MYHLKRQMKSRAGGESIYEVRSRVGAEEQYRRIGENPDTVKNVRHIEQSQAFATFGEMLEQR